MMERQSCGVARAWGLAVVISLLATGGAVAAEVTAYPHPPIYELSDTFTLRAAGKPIPVVAFSRDYDYAHFSMANGPVPIEIVVNGRPSIEVERISPMKLGIQATTRGNRLGFVLREDAYLIVKIKGLKELVIAADPAEQDKPARAGPGIFNVVNDPYRADRTGARLSTQAIQQAIDDASRYGGEHGEGIVYVPAGVYLAGNLVLKSNSSLYLEGGSVLRCTGNREDYQKHWRKISMQADITWFLCTEDDAKHIKVYGRGTIDGNGWNLWENSKQGGRMANNILVPKNVSGFEYDGPIVRDSSAWAVIPVRSDNLVFRNLKLLNRLNMGENDGIDVVECQDVRVEHSIGIALDDPFSTKTWAEDTDIALNWTGRPEAQRNVVIDDALSWTHCYGFKVGQGVMQDQQGITFRNGVVYDAAVGLGVHHRYGSAAARNITFEGMEVERLHGENDGKATWFACLIEDRGHGAGPVEGLTLRNIKAHVVGRSPAMLKGFSESVRVTGVTFDHISMPELSEPAANLAELNLLNREFYEDVTILPKQSPEPAKRTNLAYGRPVKVSSNVEFAPEHAVDGDLGTRWGSERSDDQWIAVDLGGMHRINGARIHWEVAYGEAYDFQVSSDASRWVSVYSTRSGDGYADEVRFEPIEARYVRVMGHKRGTKYGYSIWELEVFPAAEKGDSALNPAEDR